MYCKCTVTFEEASLERFVYLELDPGIILEPSKSKRFIQIWFWSSEREKNNHILKICQQNLYANMSQKSALNLTRTFLQNFLWEIRLKKMKDELNASQRLNLKQKVRHL